MEITIDYFRPRPDPGGAEAGVTVMLASGDRASFRASGVDYVFGSGPYATSLHEVMVWKRGVDGEVARVTGTSDVLWVLHEYLEERFALDA